MFLEHFDPILLGITIKPSTIVCSLRAQTNLVNRGDLVLFYCIVLLIQGFIIGENQIGWLCVLHAA